MYPCAACANYSSDGSLSRVSKGPRANNCHGPRLALIRHWEEGIEGGAWVGCGKERAGSDDGEVRGREDWGGNWDEASMQKRAKERRTVGPNTTGCIHPYGITIERWTLKSKLTNRCSTVSERTHSICWITLAHPRYSIHFTKAGRWSYFPNISQFRIFVLSTPWVKKQDTTLLAITLPTIIRFSFFSLADSVVNLQQTGV